MVASEFWAITEGVKDELCFPFRTFPTITRNLLHYSLGEAESCLSLLERLLSVVKAGGPTCHPGTAGPPNNLRPHPDKVTA